MTDLQVVPETETETEEVETESVTAADLLGDWESLGHDGVSKVFAQQIAEGFEVVVDANAILLEQESETGVRALDKYLKEFDPKNPPEDLGGDKDAIKQLTDAKTSLEKAQAALKSVKEKSHNIVRVVVFKQEEKEDTDVDKDELKEKTKTRRQMVMDGIGLIKQYSELNGLKDVYEWASNLSVPQVGRQGSSTVGQKKPRARVSIDGQTFESFGAAAKRMSTLLSTEEAPVVVTSGDLVTAWIGVDSPKEFEYDGHKVGVVPTKSSS